MDHAESIEWVKPKKWHDLGAIAFRLKEIPDQEFILIFPEWFTSNEIGIRAKFAWNDPPTMGTWEEGPYSATARLRFEMSGQDFHLKWVYRFRNEHTHDLVDLAAFNCFNLNWAPLFKDLAMERTWAQDSAGGRVLLKDVAKIQGDGKRTMQFYPAAHGVDLSRSGIIKKHGVTSSESLSGDRIGVIAKDSQWLVETIVEGPAAYFFNNWECDHGCVHAAALFGAVKPGGTSIAKGRVTFTKLNRRPIPLAPSAVKSTEGTL